MAHLDGQIIKKCPLPIRAGAYFKYGAGIAAAAGVGIWSHGKFTHARARKRLQTLVVRKREERERQFDSYKSLAATTTQEERGGIVELALDELIRRLQSRELSAKKVLEAYVAKSLEATNVFNCITEFIPGAVELAEGLDKLDTVKGPLHGVPFCVKDDTHIEGLDSTIGLAKNLFRPATETAVMVQVLIDLGAIPYCRTNTSQGCLSFDSHNPIFGRTLNPLNTRLGPGGSSSGTGALIGAKACPFGTGSDTGGSARHPAHFCGISSLKSTNDRVGRRGSLYCVENCIGFPPTPCIMAQRAVDLAAIFRHLTAGNEMHKYDAKTVPVAWNPMAFESPAKLRIGYFTSLDVCPTLGDTPKMVLRAKAILESVGHEVVPFELKNLEEYCRLVGGLENADLGQHLRQQLEHEDISACIQDLYDGSRIPGWHRQLFAWLPSWVQSLSQYARASQAGMNTRHSSDLWDCVARKTRAVDALIQELNDLGVDLILSPVFPTPAMPPVVMEARQNNTSRGVYLEIWNLLDFPAGVVPIGVESGQHVTDDVGGDDSSSSFTELARQHMKESVGMPIGVQIIGKPYQEELVLRGMVELERLKDHLEF